MRLIPLVTALLKCNYKVASEQKLLFRGFFLIATVKVLVFEQLKKKQKEE
jgi:hypothetical protein